MPLTLHRTLGCERSHRAQGFLAALLGTLLLWGAQGTAHARWASLEIIDVDAHPWDTEPRFGANTKTILRGANESSLIYIEFNPQFDVTPHRDPLGPHYHHWHEWAYTISGDFVIHEPVSPKQQNAPVYRFVEGTWLDRPAYTIHGGGWESGGIRAQNPATMLLFEGGDGSVVTFGPDGDHFFPDFPDRTPDPYRPNWDEVERFARPWIVHSAQELDWEWDQVLPKRLVKWLSDHIADGFRAQLVKIPPGWAPPEDTPRKYYEHAHRLRFMLHGDMKVWRFDGPGDDGEPVNVRQNHLIHQPPRSLWGYGDGEVSHHGAIWLEVTYGRDFRFGGGAIEEPIPIE